MEVPIEGTSIITRLISLRTALVTLLLTYLLYVYVQKRGQDEVCRLNHKSKPNRFLTPR